MFSISACLAKIHVISFKVIGLKPFYSQMIDGRVQDTQIGLTTCYSLLRRHIAEKNLLLKERKLSAVKLVSAGKNKGRTL
jgi:hypothetical protein